MNPSRPSATSTLRMLTSLSVFMAGALVARSGSGQTTHAHAGSSEHHHDGPSFAHPLIAESPLADTQVRVDYIARSVRHEGVPHSQSLMHLETAYALSDHLGVEVRLPYTIADGPGAQTGLGVEGTEVGFNLASSVIRQPNVLLRLGLEVGVVVGGYGTDATLGGEIEPYVTLGYRWSRLEVLTFAVLGLPTGRNDEGRREAELGYNLSVLYRLTPRLQSLAEFHGAFEHGESASYATPGLKIRPLSGADVWIGLGATLPLAGHEEFETQGTFSLFYHF